MASIRLSSCWIPLAVIIACSTTPAANADPCGMVPPIYLGNDAPIARIGDQNTYVFFKNGVETFVIRPGFSGPACSSVSDWLEHRSTRSRWPRHIAPSRIRPAW